jgi:hypothetical protein
LEAAAQIVSQALQFAAGANDDPFTPMGFAVRRAFFRSIDQVIPPRGRVAAIRSM